MQSRLLNKSDGGTKRAVLLTALLLLLCIGAGHAQEERRGRQRGHGHARDRGSFGDTVYATADDGTPLTWKVIPAAGPGPHPAILVIHGGHFAKTPVSPNSVRAAHDAAAAGFNAFLVDYRLAGGDGLSGQKSSGRYPDQTNDLKQAVRAARAYPGGNGKVGAIGGSAGASHVVYLAATGLKGDDRLDAGVGLSGAYDLVDLASSPRGPIRRKIENYVGSSNPDAVAKASPITYVDRNVSPLFLVASDNENMPPNQLPALVRKLQSVGATNFRQIFRTNSHRHAFSNWPIVRDEVIEFLKRALGDPGGGTNSSNPSR